MDIRGCVAVVTGAARGLGRRFALDLSRGGAIICAFDLDWEGLSSLKEEIEGAGGTVDIQVLDVRDEDSVTIAFENAVEQRGKIDVLINNAGVTGDHFLVKRSGSETTRFPLDLWQKVVDVNLTGVFLCAREAACKMIEKAVPGVIINISSISRHGNMGQSSYSATKAGVVALTVTWAKELSRYGIRVAAVAPGFVDTPMARSVPEKVMEKIVAGIPAGRLGVPEEVSKAVRFIIENDYVNGRVIEVDGGLRL